MAELKGTNVAAGIVPFTSEDKYATHSEEYGRGGYRTVNTISEMNAIPSDRRKEGMLVNVVGGGKYELKKGVFVKADFGNGGGGGTSNAKILTTPGIFNTDRNESIELSYDDIKIISSLFSDGYKSTQLYYIDNNSIYSVNIYCNEFELGLPSSGTYYVYASITNETGIPIWTELEFDTDNSLIFSWAADINNGLFAKSYNHGLNGYEKFNDGLMIQWGQNTTGQTSNRTIYLPTSFYDTNYIVVPGIFGNAISIENALYNSALISRSVSSFVAANRFYNGSFGYSGLAINWIAIGRWK